MSNFQNLLDEGLVVLATKIPPVKEFIITFPSSGSFASDITWNIKRSDGTEVINGTVDTYIGIQNVSATELTYDGSYVLNMFDSFGDGWDGYAIAVSSTDASGNTYTRVIENTGPASGVKGSPGASVNLSTLSIAPKTAVVRTDLQSMIALGHTIPELVAWGIYTNQLIQDEFTGADGINELTTSSYGSHTNNELISLGYSSSTINFLNLINAGLLSLNASDEVIALTEVVRADLQSMIALGHTIPELVAGGIYTNQLIKDEFSGADVLELTTSSYGSVDVNDMLNLGYTNSEVGVYFEYWAQLGADIDGEAGDDESGYAVSLSSDGTIVAIGAPYNDVTGMQAGHVRVYQYSSTSWTQLGADIDGEAGGDQSGHSVSLSSDGTIVAIGAIGARFNDGYAGHVRVYQYSSDSKSWTQLGADIDGEASFDQSGYSVSLSSDGTIVAIGAPFNDGYAGHVRIYQYYSGSWTQLGADIDGEAGDDYSGYSVSLSSDGTIVAIGARFNDGTASNAGHVRVYQYSSGSKLWTKLGADIDGEAGSDESGYSVSLSSDGTIVAIGAPYNDGFAGHVRVYQYSSDSKSWTQLGADIDGETGASGRSVSLSSDGTIVAIGAPYNGIAGHVRVYQYSSGLWTKLVADIDGEADYEQSGWSVSLSSDGTIVAIGARFNDGTASNAGHVRVYNLQTPAPPATICFPAGTPVTTDQGNIAIEKINSHIHTVRGKSIIAITQTRPLEKHIVSIETDALVKNVPSQTTEISLNHKVFYKGQMIKARDLVDVCEHVHFIPYNGETLYNVLLEEHDKMMINNLICETLSPKNIMAIISKMNEGTEKNRILRELTCIIKKNDVSGYKKLYASLK